MAGLAALVEEFRELDRLRAEGGLRLAQAKRYAAIFAELTTCLSGRVPHHERRQFLRIPRPMTVSFGFAGRRALGLSIDFGRGGLFLVCDARIATGDVLRLDHVVIGKQAHRLKIDAVAVWRSPQEEPSGVGLAFRAQTPEQVEDVEQVFQKLLALYTRDDRDKKTITVGK